MYYVVGAEQIDHVNKPAQELCKQYPLNITRYSPFDNELVLERAVTS